MLLVTNGSRRSEDEGAGDNDGHERQTEKQEGVFGHGTAILGCECASVGRAAEFFVLKDSHRKCSVVDTALVFNIGIVQ